MSKELTPLEIVEAFRNLMYVHLNDKLLDTIETELKEGEKNKKALEIIKKKCKFFSLKSDEDNFFCCPQGHYRVYDSELYQFNELTKEEYDLLKEILK